MPLEKVLRDIDKDMIEFVDRNFPLRRDKVVALMRFAVAFEVIALAVAGLLGIMYAAATRTDFLEGFFLWTFVVFLVVLVYGVLSGPGLFLSRPRFVAVGPDSRQRWRRWLSAPPVGGDREFFDLILYVGLAFLLLAIAAWIGAVARALGG